MAYKRHYPSLSRKCRYFWGGFVHAYIYVIIIEYMYALYLDKRL